MSLPDKKLIFVVDDDPIYTKVVSEYLSKEIPNLEFKLFNTGEACLHELDLEPVAIVMDYFMNSEFENAWNGQQILKKILNINPSMSVIIISAQHDMEVALNCLRLGAFDYIIKNENALPAIKSAITNVIDETVEY